MVLSANRRLRKHGGQGVSSPEEQMLELKITELVDDPASHNPPTLPPLTIAIGCEQVRNLDAPAGAVDEPPVANVQANVRDPVSFYREPENIPRVKVGELEGYRPPRRRLFVTHARERNPMLSVG